MRFLRWQFFAGILVSIVAYAGFYFTALNNSEIVIESKEPSSGILTGLNYDDCKAKLTQAGWCKIESGKPTAHMNSVTPDTHTPQGWLGTASNMLSMWTDGAFDAENKVMYFWGGGHGDYAGNEVYSFDFNVGEWTRLTNPSPLDFIAYDWSTTSRYIKIPDTRLYPPSSHSYGGLAFNHVTKKLIVLVRTAANKIKASGSATDSNFLLDGQHSSQWEFDPVLAEALGQDQGHKAWKKLGTFGVSYPRAFMMKDKLIIGAKSKLYNVEFNQDGTISSLNTFLTTADWGDSNAEYDEGRNLIWANHGAGKALLAYTPQGVEVYKFIKPPVAGKSIAFDSNNNIVVWDGCNKVGTYTPETNTWVVDDWRDKGMDTCSEGVGKVYGKWVNVEGDYFVGISAAKWGMWVYRSGRPPEQITPNVDVKTINDITATTPLLAEGFEDAGWQAGWTKSNRLGGSQAKAVEFARSSIVSTGCITGNCLRLDLLAGSGWGAAIYRHIEGNHDSIVAEYWLKLADNFSPVFYDKNGVKQGSGGKFPGLSDTDGWPDQQCGNGGYKADGINCWSARSTFQRCSACVDTNRTRIGGYIYAIGTKSNHGDFAAFDGDSKGGWLSYGNGTHGQLENGRWYKVQIQVTMNTPGFHNGIYRAWIDDQLAFDKTDMVWRLPNHDNLHVKSFWLNVVYGGVAVSPAESTYILMDELKIYKAGG